MEVAVKVSAEAYRTGDRAERFKQGSFKKKGS
jgi:hypothetical protein